MKKTLLMLCGLACFLAACETHNTVRDDRRDLPTEERPGDRTPDQQR